ncbi:M28 family peptidase [Pontibacter sp. BT310]|uniref:M28 family peptidase n=1 Tax=Pontibacter populi TaxID=890055 RepID=A0ABS6XES3_9BACT|nr:MULTISPECIES: M28 family peptidase [Pontibacter]MBJ6119554.1 M28 family peptidase [Pontibacter sp. BT310]MBR0571981.1 M28 family peptidase [Microvirga sp. STS03]MBW3366407.1 M28 family peptidase [Pontibacter populi]
MKNKLNLIAILFCGALALYSCDSSEKSAQQETTVAETENEPAGVKAPAFNADSAYKFVAKQVAFGPRVPNTQPHKVTGDWIISKLKGYGADVKVQEFQMRAYDGTMLNLRNIIASYNPEAGTRIMLAAHWDTRPYADKDTNNQKKPIDGANDGGSGVAVLLEIARTINGAQQKPDVGVDLFFFDGEDYGQPDDSELPYVEDSWCLGSQYWSRNKHTPNYTAKYGILLDMVGAENARFAREGTSMQYAKNVVDKVWKAGNQLGYSDYFKYVNAPAITDDHAYINAIAKIPMIDIVEYNMSSIDGDFFGDYHHRHSDSMAIISPKTLKAVGQTVLHVVYNE